MHLNVIHRINYRFSEPQARLVQLLRLMPQSIAGQSVIDWRLDVECDARIKFARDGFGNEAAMLYIDGPVDQVSVVARGEVFTEDRAGMIHGTVETLPPLFYRQSTPLTAAPADLIEFAEASFDAGDPPLTRAHRLKDALHDRLIVDTSGYAPLSDAATAFKVGAGSYQDGAQVFVAAARALGFPGRYVSGFVSRGEDEDAAHAWAEIWIEDYGWIAFDVAHGMCPDHRYIRVAVGLDRRDAAPVSGTRTGGGSEALTISAQIVAYPIQG